VDPWSKAIAAAVDAMAPRLVSVSSVDARQQVAVGTGFCLDGRHVLTHSRLYTPGDRLSVAFADGQRFGAEVVAGDPLYYLAVLRLQGEVALDPVEPAPAEELRAGTLVLALGNSFRGDSSVSLGVVSAPDRTVYRPERFPVDGLILTDAMVRVQDIGGPLVTLEGHWLGTNATPWMNGFSAAVQAGVVRRLVDQMLRYGRATHPWLGFTGQTEVVPPALAALMGLPVQRGVAVSDVVAGGPGDRAGVRVFDVVVRVDGQPVDSLGAIRRQLAYHRPGESAALTVLRGETLRDLEMPVEEMPRLAPTPWAEG
jgi:serine protease Do